MGMLKRWRYLLLASVCGVAIWAFAAYLASPACRASQAYGRIEEGMTRSDAEDIIHHFGGEATLLTGYLHCQATYCFGDRCSISLWIQRPSPDDGPQFVKEKKLNRLTFTEWISSCVESVKSRATSKSNTRFTHGAP